MLWGGGALQFLDLRLLEDGGERGGALGSEAVVRDAVSEGQDQNGERVGVSTRALTQKRPLGGYLGAVAHLSEVTALPLSPSHSLVMPSTSV